MKVTIVGATGNSGTALTRLAVADGHEVAVVVRDPRKLDATVRDRVTVHTVDLHDPALVDVFRGQDVVINAAGYVSETDRFVAFVAAVAAAAEQAMGAGGRFFAYGGAALLDVPGVGVPMIGLPGVPQAYAAHLANYRMLQATQLDWSIVCPGPMIESPDGSVTPGLRIATEEWATPAPNALRWLPPLARSLAFKRAVGQITVSYEDVARVILDHLAPEGSLSHARVAIALPEGMTRSKSDAFARLRTE